MKVRVISLKSREDRRVQFEKANSAYLEGHDWSFIDAVDGSTLTHRSLVTAGFDTDKNWRDPSVETHTHQG